MSTKRHDLRRIAAIAAALGLAQHVHDARAIGVDRAARASELTTTLDVDEARAELAAADPESPDVAFERARLAIYEGDCDGAAAILTRPDLAASEAGGLLSDLARGCARVVAATVVERDAARAVEVRYQDESDRALQGVLVDTIVRARDALTRDLGVTWPKPTRVVVVRDLLSLSAMTGLPYASAQTTGTVAVAKWGRVTLLSPRASRHGYVWRDTIAHELTHLAVTRATADRAPLWLQEGLAKRGETRWREPGPFDDRPSPESVVERGIELKLDLPLDKLGPSIAMLPSADAAMVAFAEVTSFVRFYAETAGAPAIGALLAALRAGKTPDEALREASGADLKEWDARWRAALATRKKTAAAATSVFALGGEPAGARDAREHVRIAELLFGRRHPTEALAELDKIGAATSGDRGSAAAKELAADPSLRHLRARCLEALGRGVEAQAAVGEAADVAASFGPWWAVRGRLALSSAGANAGGAGANAGGDAGANANANANANVGAAIVEPSFAEAVAADPLDVESTCRTTDDAPAGPAPALSPDVALLCDAARARGEPRLGAD